MVWQYLGGGEEVKDNLVVLLYLIRPVTAVAFVYAFFLYLSYRIHILKLPLLQIHLLQLVFLHVGKGFPISILFSPLQFLHLLLQDILLKTLRILLL